MVGSGLSVSDSMFLCRIELTGYVWSLTLRKLNINAFKCPRLMALRLNKIQHEWLCVSICA